MLYQEPGARHWKGGQTVNVSRSGVLFRPDEPLPATLSDLNFTITLPPAGGSPAPHVRCTGRIVRRAMAGGGGVVAVSIDGWAFAGKPRN
jgi:hypothetical protein